jgi:uncharacterized protein with FMN-binding domain
MMKKIVTSGVVILTFITYVVNQRMGGADIVAPSVRNAKNSNSSIFVNSSIKTSSRVAGPAPEPIAKTIPKPLAKQVATAKPNTTPAPAPIPAAPIPAPAPVPVPVQTGKYRNGQYIGPVTDAYYGNVQVRATVSGGKIVAVDFLDYPQDRNTSRNINSQAMPYLKQEAIQAQSANVDIISGATATSEAFVISLGSALSQALN